MGAIWFNRDASAQVVLPFLAVWAAWFPVEVRPLTAVAVAAVVLFLCAWGWRNQVGTPSTGIAGGCVVFFVFLFSAGSGWDSSRAVGEIGLVAAVVVLAWLASNSEPPTSAIFVFALGLCGLAAWGIWQVVAGFDVLAPGLDALPDATRAYAEERVAGRRAYASLPLPSHLAVLLATALPILVIRVKATASGVVAGLGVGLAMAGLVATQSPVGITLALAAVVAVIGGRYRRELILVVGLLTVALAIVVVLRPDVMRLEPVTLRLDNWRTAIWLSGTSPASGVGFSSFAQASQAVPFEVGNRPAHAHNLPLEALAEFGPAGLIGCLLLGTGLLFLMKAVWPKDRGLAVALAVVPLHNLVDFSFFVSGVALPWAVLLGWGIASSREPVAASRMTRGRMTMVIVAAVAFVLTLLQTTSIVIEDTAASKPVAVDRFDGALKSLRLAPWRVEPQFLLASAALEAGKAALCEQAWTELDRRRWWRPRSAALAERRARVALARGDVTRAISELWVAIEYGHPGVDRDATLQELLTALEGEAHAPSS